MEPWTVHGFWLQACDARLTFSPLPKDEV